MEIKLFSLMKGDAAQFAANKKIISDCANSFTQDEEKFKNFSSPKRMLLAVSQALRSADAVIIAVQNTAYNSIKKMICSSFNMELEQNEEIYSRLLPFYEAKKITKTALENNSAFPNGADIFGVSDFKCCGFSVTSGAQSIIVLPLDDKKTAEVVFGSLYEFLASAAGVENAEDISTLKTARLAAKLQSILKKDKSQITFASLGGAQLIEEAVNLIDGGHDTLLMGEKPEARRSSQTVEEYIVGAAQKTRENGKTEYACAVSSAFASNTDDSTFIYFAVADENETFVSKLYAREGESPKQLYRSAVENAFLACVARADENVRAKKSENRREDKLLRQKAVFIAAAAVAGATGICALAALLLN